MNVYKEKEEEWIISFTNMVTDIYTMCICICLADKKQVK